MTSTARGDWQQEFSETFGYVRGDLRWLLKSSSHLNYTVGFLIACACEMLAACRGDSKRRGERVFEELLPREWQFLAARLYGALRDGLAHGFDTKHLRVDGIDHQIHLDASGQGIVFVKTTRGIGLSVGLKVFGEDLCRKIDDFEQTLASDETARKRFLAALQPTTRLTVNEADGWRALLSQARVGRP